MPEQTTKIEQLRAWLAKNAVPILLVVLAVGGALVSWAIGEIELGEFLKILIAIFFGVPAGTAIVRRVKNNNNAGLWLLLILLLPILAVGCMPLIPQEAGELARRHYLLQKRFAELVLAGKVPASEIVRNSLVNAEAWRNFDRLLNGESPENRDPIPLPVVCSEADKPLHFEATIDLAEILEARRCQTKQPIGSSH